MTTIIKLDRSRRLRWAGQDVRCVLGRNGIVAAKDEGDGGTPTGVLPLRRVFYRADRLDPPRTPLPLVRLQPNDGWCDDPANFAYNTHVKLPYPASCEELWRDDHLYDVIVVLGYNDDPPVAGRGSAIFLHVAHSNFRPTEGCVALVLEDLLNLLESIGGDAAIQVQGSAT